MQSIFRQVIPRFIFFKPFSHTRSPVSSHHITGSRRPLLLTTGTQVYIIVSALLRKSICLFAVGLKIFINVEQTYSLFSMHAYKSRRDSAS
jgi:hypothetical protein